MNRLKYCNGCRIYKSLCLFKKTPPRKFGVGPKCKSCNNIEYRNWYYSDVEKARLSSKKYRENNPEKRKATVRAWDRSEAGIDHHRNMAHTRRLQKGSERVNYSHVYLNSMGLCHICWGPVDANIKFPNPMSGTIDHVIALANGGEHSYENCMLAHNICNIKKGVN